MAVSTPLSADGLFFVYSGSFYGHKLFLIRSDFLLHFLDHYRQFFFAFFPGFGVDIAGDSLAVGISGRVFSFPEVVAQLVDAAGACLTVLAFVRLKAALIGVLFLLVRRHGCESMPQIVEANGRQLRIPKQGFLSTVGNFRRQRKLRHRWIMEDPLAVGFLFSCFQDLHSAGWKLNAACTLQDPFLGLFFDYSVIFFVSAHRPVPLSFPYTRGKAHTPLRAGPHRRKTY